MITRRFVVNPHYTGANSGSVAPEQFTSMDAMLRHYSNAEKILLDFIAEKTDCAPDDIADECQALGLVVDSE